VGLHVETRGAGPPLVLLHGFTQTARLWGRFGDMLAEQHTLIGVDLPGHGGSDSVRADLPATADLVTEAVRSSVGSGPCALLGYSLGARVALHVALGTDLALSHLVVIGATGGIEDPEARAMRRGADEEMAARLESSGDLDAFLTRWVSGPMFARLVGSGAADVDERRRNTASGLASSLRLCGTGTQAPLWDRVGSLGVPLLALAGTDDVRFGAHAQRLAALAPAGAASLVPGGGHAVHLAQPGAVGQIIGHWLAFTGGIEAEVAQDPLQQEGSQP
jgi:2-succinyl-6-hydroxy-2,4-cyclohexadiene-1-carboxylate synthase